MLPSFLIHLAKASAPTIFFEEIRLPESGQEWGAVLALAIICSGVGFTIQPFGQKYTTPERAGILAVFNPLTAAVLGVIFLHETMTGSMIIGAVMILISILAPAWIQDRRSRTGNDAG